jgi:hypothetical protein
MNVPLLHDEHYGALDIDHIFRNPVLIRVSGFAFLAKYFLNRLLYQDLHSCLLGPLCLIPVHGQEVAAEDLRFLPCKAVGDFGHHPRNHCHVCYLCECVSHMDSIYMTQE